MLHPKNILFPLLLLLICIDCSFSIEIKFRNGSQNNDTTVTKNPPGRKNDPLESLVNEMVKYVKDCKLDVSEESNENEDTTYKKRFVRSTINEEMDDDDASFSSRQYVLSKIQNGRKRSNNQNNTNQEKFRSYGRNNDDVNNQNYNSNRHQNRNNQNRNNNQRDDCNQDDDFSNQNNRNNRNNNYYGSSMMSNSEFNRRNNDDDSNRGNNGYYDRRSSDGYATNMESFFTSNNGYNKHNREKRYGSSLYNFNAGPPRRSSTWSYNRNDESNSNNNQYYGRNREYFSGRQQGGNYPTTDFTDWSRSEENIECIARCIFGYLDVVKHDYKMKYEHAMNFFLINKSFQLDEEKSPSEVSLIKWLQDHESDNNKRIKGLKKMRRCFGRLSTSDIEESCEFSRALTQCLNIDIKNLSNH